MGWLDLLVRDATAEEFTAFGASSATRASETATAFELRALLQQRALRAGELSALNDIAARLAALNAPADLLPEIVEQARRLLRVDLAYLGLVESDRPAMRIEVTSGALTPELLGLTVPLSTGLAGQVITTAAPRWISDYRTASSFRHDPAADAAAAAENMRGLLGVPLAVRGRVLGALFACKRSERRFSEEEVALLSGLAAHAAIALDNAQTLHRLGAARDELTRRAQELEHTLTWDQRLTQVVLRGGGSEDLLTEVTSAAGAPVAFVRAGGPPPAGVEAQHLAAAAAGPRGDPVINTGGGRYLVARRVLAADREFGVLVMSGAGQPSRDDLLLVDRAVPVLALALLAEDAAAEASRRARDSLLVELLTVTDPGRSIHQVRQAGLDPATPYTVVVIQPHDDLAATRQFVGTLPWPPGTNIVTCQGRLVALAPHDNPELLTRLWPAAGRRDTSTSNTSGSSGMATTAGIAGPVRPSADLAGCHREAVETLDALLALELDGTACTGEQLGLFRIVLGHTGRRQLDAAFDRSLGSVVAEQDKRGIPLVETMERFLTQGRRPRPTATALGIHINTLYQRLALIDRLLGQRWREPGPALELQLLLRLRSGAARLSGAIHNVGN